MLDQMYLLMISDEILLEMQLLIYHGHEGIVRLVWFRTNTPGYRFVSNNELIFTYGVPFVVTLLF